MPSIINATTTAGVAITGDNSGNLAIQTNNGNTAVTVTTAQNVGIGTTSPAAKLDSRGNALFGANGRIQLTESSGDAVIGGTAGTNFTAFTVNNTERMRIDSDGNLLVGTTGISTGTFKGIQNAAGGTGANFLSRNSSGTASRQWNFGMNSVDEYVVYGHSGTSFNSGAYIAWGGTSWTAQSDERSKDIIEPITDAVNKVATLRAVIGKYKTDEEGKRRSFLIAQDVQAVLPEAVDASKPDNLGVQYTEVIPLLVAAIKELNAKVDAQAVRIAELEGAK
jgi:hypothetical protein